MTDRLILQIASVSGCANTVNSTQGLEHWGCTGNPCFMIAKYGLLQVQYDFEPILIFFLHKLNYRGRLYANMLIVAIL